MRYLSHSHNDRTVPVIITAGCTAHAQSGHISTYVLTSDVIIVFLSPNFRRENIGIFFIAHAQNNCISISGLKSPSCTYSSAPIFLKTRIFRQFTAKIHIHSGFIRLEAVKLALGIRILIIVICTCLKTSVANLTNNNIAHLFSQC